MTPLLVTTTTAKLEEAESMAAFLVTDKLAACVNIVGPVTSVYSWQEKVEKEQEFKLFIKSSQEHWPRLKKAIKTRHSYDTPEITAISIYDMSEEYKLWLENCIA